MLQAYKYQLKSSKATTEKLNGTLDICQELYNAGLQKRSLQTLWNHLSNAGSATTSNQRK
ncbi:MAG: helix-turn-helix domain-containing protein [Blastocatellia bacterium]|nr:helix-turn-helix domain-containing protein [Blastocatellia bacterium]